MWPQNERGLLGKPDPSELTAAAVGILTGRFCYGVQPRSNTLFGLCVVVPPEKDRVKSELLWTQREGL